MDRRIRLNSSRYLLYGCRDRGAGLYATRIMSCAEERPRSRVAPFTEDERDQVYNDLEKSKREAEEDGDMLRLSYLEDEVMRQAYE